MRGAFVLQLASGSRPRDSHFEGWIEEVDSGPERRFRSTEELMTFLAQCLVEAKSHDYQPGPQDRPDSSGEGE
jgi:hypothetical protein